MDPSLTHTYVHVMVKWSGMNSTQLQQMHYDMHNMHVHHYHLIKVKKYLIIYLSIYVFMNRLEYVILHVIGEIRLIICTETVIWQK